MKRDGAEGGQIVQEPVREGGQQVIVETELGGPSRETGRQRRSCERSAATVHLAAVTGAEMGTGGGPLTSKQEEQTHEQKLLHGS